MGRVIDDGGVFAPRLEVKRIQQGRIPFRERLAERYLSPTGVAQTMKNVGQIASLLGDIEFDPTKQKTGQDAAKSVAQQRIGGELPEGMTRVGMATGQGAPTVDLTGRQAGRQLVSRTAEVGSGPPVLRDNRQPSFTGSSRPLMTAQAGVDQKAESVMRAYQGLGLPAMDESPAASQGTYELQKQLVAEGFLSPEDWMTGPGVFGRKTTAAVERKRAAEAVAATPEPQEMPAEPFVPGAVAPDPTRAPGAPVPAEVVAAAPVPQAMEPEPYVPTDRPVEPAAAPVAPAMTQRQRIRKVLADISSPTYEGQQNALRAMAMQADTAEAQSAIMNALSEVAIPARSMRDFLRPKSRRDAFREEIRRLFPGVKKPPAPMTEKERLGLEMQQRRLDIAEEQLDAAKERRADEREERKRRANERDQKRKTNRRRGALRATRGTGRANIDNILKQEMTENNKTMGRRDPTVTRYRENMRRANSDLRSLRSQEKRLRIPLKHPGNPPKKTRGMTRGQHDMAMEKYNDRLDAWRKADDTRKDQLDAVQGRIGDLNKMVKGYSKGIEDVQDNYKRQKLYQTVLNRLRIRGARMPAEEYENYSDRILSINMSNETNEKKIESFRGVLDEIAGRGPGAQASAPEQDGTPTPEDKNIKTLKRQLQSIAGDIENATFKVRMKPRSQYPVVLVEGDISPELRDKIVDAVRRGQYVSGKDIALPVGGN